MRSYIFDQNYSNLLQIVEVLSIQNNSVKDILTICSQEEEVKIFFFKT